MGRKPNESTWWGAKSSRTTTKYWTIGKVFDKAPGFIGGLTVTMPEDTTWEIDDKGLKLPKYVTVSCDYTYINKHLPSTTGKHYDLPWLENHGQYGTFKVAPKTKLNISPDRVGTMKLVKN